MVWKEGTKVEVNRKDEWVTGVWYEATILKSSTSKTNASALVQYQTLYNTLKSNKGGGSKKPLTELIPGSHIRPIPPSSSSSCSKGETFELNDVVDAFYRGGWWGGVITRVLPNSSFSVSLHGSSDNNKLHLDSSALRFSLSWDNGIWVRPKKGEVITTAQYPEKQLGHSVKAIRLESSGCGAANDKAEERSLSPTKSGKNPIRRTTPRKKIISYARISSNKKLKQATPCSDATISRPLKRAKKRDATDYNGGDKVETTQQEVEDGNHTVDSLGAADAVGKDCTSDEIELPINSTGISSGGTMNQWDEGRESQVGLPQIDCTDNKVLPLNSKLPFVKSSRIWEMIDSMEVFQAMQQSPHFHPLYDFTEGGREGLAIGLSVTFANLVEKTRKLQLDDPRSIWVSYLETLLDLETHGFDVQVLRSRLNELLAIKDRQEQNLDKLKKCEGQLLEVANKKSKNEEAIEEFIKKIREFKEERASFRSIKKIQDAEIATSQLRGDDIREGIRSTQLDFERVTVAPW